MKTVLLILMTLASVAMAQTPMSDAEMTKLIVGTWRSECTYDTIEYKSDGTVAFDLNGEKVVEKWWVKDGALLETDSSIKGGECYYKILFLTEDEWLILGMTPHAKGYIFRQRKDY
jgi:hypothetical protein